MKRTIYLIVFLTVIKIFGQDIIDPPNLFFLQNSSLNQDISYLATGNNNNFLLGWNCITNTNINRPNNFLGADNSASKKFFVQLIKFA